MSHTSSTYTARTEQNGVLRLACLPVQEELKSSCTFEAFLLDPLGTGALGHSSKMTKACDIVHDGTPERRCTPVGLVAT